MAVQGFWNCPIKSYQRQKLARCLYVSNNLCLKMIFTYNQQISSSNRVIFQRVVLLYYGRTEFKTGKYTTAKEGGGISSLHYANSTLHFAYIHRVKDYKLKEGEAGRGLSRSCYNKTMKILNK